MLLLLYGMFMPLVLGTGMLIAGPFFIIKNTFVITVISYIAAISLPVASIYSIINKLVHRIKVPAVSVILACIDICISAYILLLPKFSFNTFVAILELYLLFLLSVRSVDSYIYCKNKQWSYFVPSVAQFAVGIQIFIALIVCPESVKEYIVFFGIGLMLNIYGLSQICDFLIFTFKSRRLKKVFGTIRLLLPDLMVVFLPLKLSDYALDEEKTRTTSDDYNVEVFFQVSDTGIGVAGHCELCYKGKTITYGNYNSKTRCLFKTIGEGIVFRAKKEEYINWAIKDNNKRIISYRLCLNEAEISCLEKEIAALENCMEEWTPCGESNGEEFADRLFAQGNVRFYRVVKGEFKTYFIPTINCVSLTSKILEKTDIGKVFMFGIKTPGAYMHLLHRLYLAGDSVVVSRTVYG